MGRIKHPERVLWNLKKALVERRMIVTDLATLVGTSRVYLSHVIMGRYPGWSYRKKIAAVLGYPEDWLFKQGGNFDQDTATAATQHDPGAVVAQN